ncbi:transposase [Bacillus thuringiensis]|uniref:Transposase, IS116/IS110/IS902 n=2 Tax=Bacillus thuringiensis TaxID=1428 RepID=A0A9W3S6T1_BACTU|nr:IS110 family transposase [Bacillus thuringiensis]ANS45973.1 transposase, IS116/IS110/IS902 [Bacillus thuringiensis]ANS52362.1 transposase, IS116/IS110/IS902 [Bacillus thuringiensis]MBH0340379.1 transposase [Bacillus thuringiensis]MBH0340626.1 transposase [Bacillus thuringiensis]
MNLFVGLDVSSEKLDVCFLSDDNQLTILLETSLGNDVKGAHQIKQKILEFQNVYSFSQIVIGMESTSMYSFHPATFFNEDRELKRINTVVTIENPFRIKQFSRIFDEDKTDKNDAMRIADFLRIQRFTTSPIKEEKYMALQRLTRTRYQLIGQLVETKQHFLENLTYKCNTLTRELKNSETPSSVFGATLIALMTEDYGLEELAQMPLTDFASLLQEKGNGRFKNPERLAKTIQRAITMSYRLGEVAQESINIILSILAREIRALEASIKDLDKAIEQLVIVLPEYQCLTSIPGVGKVYAAGLLAEIGEIQRFEDQTKLAKYAGLSWKIKQSGNYQSENTPLTKQGNRYLRYYLVEAANSVRRYLPEYQAFYQKKYKETPKHQHKRAIVLTARKFVRLVDTLLRNHQLYTPPRSVIEK